MIYFAYQIYKIDTLKSTETQTDTFMLGFLMQFLNPKIVLFRLTVILSVILLYYPSILVVALNILGSTMVGFLAFIPWVLLGTIFNSFLQMREKTNNVVMTLGLSACCRLHMDVGKLIER
jgi:cysteine/O-acetylserine efflux protein